MNKQQLAAKIWQSANEMRSKIEANEYKDYILGFIFYKFLSEAEVKYLKQNGYDQESIKKYVHEDEDSDYSGKNSLQDTLGYFIDYDNLFSTWLKQGSSFKVDDVICALNAFPRLVSPSCKHLFDGIFDTLAGGISKLGENATKQTSAVKKLIALIDEIPMDGKQDYDVLGFIYEYLIGQFAANAGKKAGEFYTPHEVSLLMANIVSEHLKGKLENNLKVQIYDPTSGSGSLLLNIGRACAKYISNPNNIKYYAQELKQPTYNLTRMNLIMRGINPANIEVRNADTLEEDWPLFKQEDASDYTLMLVDAVVSNPPYSQKWDPADKQNDPRYSRYGLAPKSKADYAFLLHDLYHIKDDGIMTIVLPHGVLFRGNEEGEIRKNLIENNNIDTIIGLPANIFFGTGIPTIIMVLKKNKTNDNVLIIDASKGFTKEGTNNKLRACDIRKIVDVVVSRSDIPKFSRLVSREEIRNNDYNLNIPRYVDSSEEPETWDIYSTMFGGMPISEINRLEKYWKVFPSLKNDLFEGNGNHLSLKTEDIKQTVYDNVEVQKYVEEYHKHFSDLGEYLKKILLDDIGTVNAVQAEEQIANELFKRFTDNDLIDAYEAYELFEGKYKEISSDMEVMNSEGKDTSVRQVDPNMVMKNKNGKKTEVQEGWKGHILPFELVQKEYLKDELNQVQTKESEQQKDTDTLNELFEELSEDDKSTIYDAVNGKNDAFDFKGIKKVIKELKTYLDEDSKRLMEVLIKAQSLNEDLKKLKKEIKSGKEQLQLQTKDKITNLTDDEVNVLLYEKWITPICTAVDSLVEPMLNTLVKKLEDLYKKYSETMRDIDEQITDTEKSLCSMLEDLTGSDSDMAGLEELRKLLGGGIHE